MVKFDPKTHHRRSIRLKEYDYAQAGAYFITVVAWQREFLFGEIVQKEMKLNAYGKIVWKWWQQIPVHFPNIETGAFIVMPNHMHGIIFISERRGTVPVPVEKENKILDANVMGAETLGEENTGGMTPPLQKPTLGQIVAYFKYQSTKEMNSVENTDTITKFWQRNYHEHVIRNETDLKNKTDYIEANPSLWDEDDENPLNIK